MRNRLITTEKKTPEMYRGIPIHADSGVHEQMARLIERRLPAGSRILDLGAGAGAFSARLHDAGYAVEALDVDETKWRAEEVPFRVLDVDQGLPTSATGSYDGISCLEVIEHLENPWQFMREVFPLVRPGGYLFLSTPNTTSFLSRAIFLIKGRFHQFDSPDLLYGHINPMTAFEVETAATRAGWRVLEIRPGGYLPILDLSSWTRADLILTVLRVGVFAMARGHKRGWCLLFALQRPP